MNSKTAFRKSERMAIQTDTNRFSHQYLIISESVFRKKLSRSANDTKLKWIYETV